MLLYPRYGEREAWVRGLVERLATTFLPLKTSAVVEVAKPLHEAVASRETYEIILHGITGAHIRATDHRDVALKLSPVTSLEGKVHQWSVSGVYGVPSPGGITCTYAWDGAAGLSPEAVEGAVVEWVNRAVKRGAGN